MCLRIARTLEFLDLPKLLGSEAPQLSLDCLQESRIGYGSLTTARAFFRGVASVSLVDFSSHLVAIDRHTVLLMW